MNDKVTSKSKARTPAVAGVLDDPTGTLDDQDT